jgi:hypothetical protein
MFHHKLTLLLCSGNQRPFALDFGFDVPHDEVSLVAQSYIHSLIYDKTCFLPEPSLNTLNYKVQIVRMIKETLSLSGNVVPQSIILAVSLLAFGCVSYAFRDGDDNSDFHRPPTPSGTKPSRIYRL